VLRIVSSLIITLLFATATVAAVGEAAPRARTAVQFVDDAKAADVAAWIARSRTADLRIDYRFHTFPALLVSVPASEAELLRDLAADPLVTYVGGDTPVELCRVPDDSLFAAQRWAYNDGSNGNCNDDIDAIHAWDITTGGAEVVVAVIDHGVDTAHPDLAANCLPGYDFVENVPGVPPHFHGTACAGLIGARGDNRQGIAGVNWRVTIVPFRMYDLSHCAAAIDSAVAMGVDVISNSWSISDVPGLSLLTSAIHAANAAGVIVVNAAGNNGWDLDVPGHEKYPASYDLPLNLAVANCFRSRLYADSNWGLATVDIAAPGLEDMTCMPDSSYARFSGTSASAPLVAGAVALLIHQFPDAEPAWIVSRLLDNAEEQFRYADQVPLGRQLNLYRILDTGDRTPPAEIADVQVVDLDHDRATLAWTAPGDDGLVGQLDHYEIWQAGSELLSLCGTDPVAPGQTQTVTLENLLGSRQYTLQVMAVDEARNRSAVVSTTFTTLDPPQIELSENYVVLAAATGEVVEVSTWVSNRGAGTLDVGVVVVGSPPWLSVAPATFTVAAGDSAEVVLTADLSGACANAMATLQFTHNDPNQGALPYMVAVMVTPAPEVSGPAGVIDFGLVPLDAMACRKVMVRNLGCTDLLVAGVAMRDGTHFSVGPAPRLVPPGGSAGLQVGYHPLQIGEHDDDLLISSNSPFTPTLAIGLRGHSDEAGPAGVDQRWFANSPNPFNPETVFRFSPLASGEYRLAIHDLRGALVRELSGMAIAGVASTVTWNGVTDQGDAAPSGVYLCTLRVEGRRCGKTLKVNLVR
jgi:subtilisin family serine protease